MTDDGRRCRRAMCASLTTPTTGKDTNSEAPPAVNSAMTDLSMLALACDRTRVLSLMFSLPAAHVYYRHLGTNMDADFHDTICHGDPGDQSNQPRVDTGVHYEMTCLNEFLTKMKATAHGASNLLDQSLVYVTSDTAWGKIHTNTEWPVLLAGKAGGKLQGDGHYNFPGDNLSKALLTVCPDHGLDRDELWGRRGSRHGSPDRHRHQDLTVRSSDVRTSERFPDRPRPLSGERKWGCVALSQAPTRKPTALARSKIS